MNGVQAPTSRRVRRLVRRGLLVAALAGAGWLLGSLLATSASATPVDGERPVTTFPAEPPARTPAQGAPARQAPVGHPVTPNGGLLDGLASTMTTLTRSVLGAVEDTVSTVPLALAAVLPAPADGGPAAPLPEPSERLPDPGSPPVILPAGDAGGRTALASLPTASPATHRPATAATVPEHTSRPVAFPRSPRRTVPSQPVPVPRAAADEHANSAPEPPAKTPASPTTPGGSTVASAHDPGSGARGTHGVPTARAQLPPPSAGFTTRSRATEVSGRVDGLPATSPD